MDRVYLIIAYVMASLLGLCFGSFLNVLIYRLPRGMSIVSPPSHCICCNHRIRWYDNIPVLSYLVLRGRCRDCGARISLRYPLVELGNCLLWAGCVAWFSGYGIGMVVVACVAGSALIVVSVSDSETMLIPDSMLVILALCGIAALLLDVFGVGVGIGWQSRLIGMAAALVFFAAVYFGCRLVTGKEGLGFGDVKLMTAAGLLLGWQGLIVAVLIASLSAAVCMGIFSVFRGRRRLREEHTQEDEIEIPAKAFPFAPFLAVAVGITLFFGQPLISWYLGLFL